MSPARLIGLALLIVATISLIVFAVSFFVQPTIPVEANSILLLFVAAVLGTIAFLASLNEVSQLVERFMAVAKNSRKVVSKSKNRRADLNIKFATQNIHGREHEKEQIKWFLGQSKYASNIVCIHGFAGLGKTTLLGYASMIAQELGLHIASSGSLGNYETVAPFESFPLFIKRLMSNSQETSNLTDYEVIEEFIIQDMGESRVILIDEFRSDDARFCSDFEWFFANARSKGKHLTVMTASRTKPNLRSSLGPTYIHLVELAPPSVERMVIQRWPHATNQLDIKRLFAITGGNPQLIEYVCSNISVWVELANGQEIEFDVVREVWRNLTRTNTAVADALRILSVVARFSKEFDGVIAQSLIREWNLIRDELMNRSLVSEKQKGIYRIHDLLSTYIYAQLDSPKDIHKTVGSYYTGLRDETSWFLGFVHFAFAQDIADTKPIYYKHRERIRYFGFAPEVESALSSLLESIHGGELLFKANLLDDLGLFLLHKHRYDEALGNFDRALNLYKTSGDNVGLAWTVHFIGTVHRMMSNHKTALSFFKESERLFVLTNDIRGQSWNNREQAEVYFSLGQSNEAEGMYSLAQELSERLGDKQGQSGALRGLANILARQMRFSEAIVRFEQASRLSQEIKDKQGQAYAIEGIATCLRCQRKFSEAKNNYESALAILGEINDPAGLQVTELQRAIFFRIAGYPKEAMELYKKCALAAAELRRPGDLVRIHRGLAEIARMEGNWESALEFYAKSRLQSEELGLKLGMAHSILGSAETNRLAGQVSLDSYDEALAIYRKARIPWGIIHTVIGKGLAYLTTNDTQKARKLLYTADTYCRLLGLTVEREFIATATASVMHILDF